MTTSRESMAAVDGVVSPVFGLFARAVSDLWEEGVPVP
jgi:hypothetical protein